VLGPFARLLVRMLPARATPADPSRPIYLDQSACETPALALAGAARETLRMADVVEAMLRGALDALDRGDRKRVAETKRLDNVLDRLNGAIKAYLTALDPDGLDAEDNRRLAEILSFFRHQSRTCRRHRRKGADVDRHQTAEAGRRFLCRRSGGDPRHAGTPRRQRAIGGGRFPD
jgi:Na+/phosphate symporter